MYRYNNLLYSGNKTLLRWLTHEYEMHVNSSTSSQTNILTGISTSDDANWSFGTSTVNPNCTILIAEVVTSLSRKFNMQFCGLITANNLSWAELTRHIFFYIRGRFWSQWCGCVTSTQIVFTFLLSCSSGVRVPYPTRAVSVRGGYQIT